VKFILGSVLEILPALRRCLTATALFRLLIGEQQALLSYDRAGRSRKCGLVDNHPVNNPSAIVHLPEKYRTTFTA
jgi:hypothetical protein